MKLASPSPSRQPATVGRWRSPTPSASMSRNRASSATCGHSRQCSRAGSIPTSARDVAALERGLGPVDRRAHRVVELPAQHRGSAAADLVPALEAAGPEVLLPPRTDARARAGTSGESSGQPALPLRRELPEQRQIGLAEGHAPASPPRWRPGARGRRAARACRPRCGRRTGGGPPSGPGRRGGRRSAPVRPRAARPAPRAPRGRAPARRTRPAPPSRRGTPRAAPGSFPAAAAAPGTRPGAVSISAATTRTSRLTALRAASRGGRRRSRGSTGPARRGRRRPASR